MKPLICLILSASLGNFSFAQECSYIDNSQKVYPSSCFVPIGSSFSDNGLEISFANCGAIGKIILKFEYNVNACCLFDNVILYLEDMSIITLINRKDEWAVNGLYFYAFKLTTSEINRLKITNIAKIRYKSCDPSYHLERVCSMYWEIENEEYLGHQYAKKSREDPHPKVDVPSIINSIFK